MNGSELCDLCNKPLRRLESDSVFCGWECEACGVRMDWPKLMKQVQALGKKTGQFSLSYNSKNGEWDASFLGSTTESGCCYARSAWNAICGAMQNAIDRTNESLQTLRHLREAADATEVQRTTQ